MTYTIKQAAKQLDIDETEVLRRLKDAARPYSKERMLRVAVYRNSSFLKASYPLDENTCESLRREFEYKEFEKLVQKKVLDKAGSR